MGGMIGQTLALKAPQVLASLSLCDTSSRIPPEAKTQWEDRIKTAKTQGMEPLVEPTLARWFTEPFRKSRKDVIDRVATMIRTTPSPGTWAAATRSPRSTSPTRSARSRSRPSRSSARMIPARRSPRTG